MSLFSTVRPHVPLTYDLVNYFVAIFFRCHFAMSQKVFEKAAETY